MYWYSIYLYVRDIRKYYRPFRDYPTRYVFTQSIVKYVILSNIISERRMWYAIDTTIELLCNVPYLSAQNFHELIGQL